MYLNSKFRKRDKDTTDTNNNASDYCPDVRFKMLGADDHDELFEGLMATASPTRENIYWLVAAFEMRAAGARAKLVPLS